ncbi:hypothetical protein [Rubricoccus marinus]|uniref:Linalool dehydratase/isomerase domain-containing protein n=1 Tax=Rubricoccus marinus TaxID=716817 RepID=A0A259TYG9_9BACT|nr:hypothetical protein [Rubricoccus marinus]OZC02740.1 hypothetical protein BSZ36_06990 [Rubricoccus marinus]
MKAVKLLAAGTLAIVGLLVAAFVLTGLWRTPPGSVGRGDPALIASLRHLDAEAERGEATRMQSFFPEGYVFTRVLHGLAWAAVAGDTSVTPEVRAHALDAARLARRDLGSPEGRAPFPAAMDPPHGAFWTGWTLWLDAERLAAAPEASGELVAFRARADSLAAALTRSLDASGSPYLQSYPGRAWPADGLAGVAALAVHDRRFGDRYGPLRRRWLDAVRQRLDPETGLIGHAADPASGAPLAGHRGSSQALMLRTMAEIDPSFGREMYAAFRERFVTSRLGLPVVLEYPEGVRGAPDVDSGPIPLGVSLPGTVVAIGAARAYGDNDLARGLSQTAEAFGLPLALNGRRIYALGAMPVGDAFLAWSRGASPETAGAWPALARGWRLPVSGLALLLFGVCALPLVRVLRARARS